MKLAKVRVTNFRCFESLEIPLQPDINVFVGINGSGKTAILDAIAIALYHIVEANGGGGKRQRDYQKVALKPEDLHIVPGEDDPVIGRKDFVQIDASATDFYPVRGFPNMVPQTKVPNHIQWSNHIRYTPPKDFVYTRRNEDSLKKVYDYFETLWEQLRKSEEKAIIPLPVVAYYRADRRIQSMPDLGDIFNLNLERQTAYEWALNAGAEYKAMCQWFYLRENSELREKLQHRNEPDFELPDLHAVRQAIVNSLEHVEKVFFRDNRLMVEMLSDQEVAQELSIEQLSDGYRNLLALILDFARRLALAHPNWENPLAAPGIMLIDEIELHLHPGWEQRVIPNLRAVFPHTQLIVATHSPQVLTTVKREHVRFLTAEHTLEPLPGDVGTYGSESAHVLETVFGVHTRPRTVETVDKLNLYLQMIENQEHQTDKAKNFRIELENDLGSSDPALVHADMRIRQLEILGKKS